MAHDFLVVPGVATSYLSTPLLPSCNGSISFLGAVDNSTADRPIQPWAERWMSRMWWRQARGGSWRMSRIRDLDAAMDLRLAVIVGGCDRLARLLPSADDADLASRGSFVATGCHFAPCGIRIQRFRASR